LNQAFTNANTDPETKAIALRAGNKPGDPFCLGMDLAQLNDSLGHGAASAKTKPGNDPATGHSGETAESRLEARRAAVLAYGALLETIAQGPKPVIALVGGPVKAGGVGLVAACDIVIASESANFELSEVLFGLIPANVIPWLIGRRMSLQRCRYLILTAACLDAATAREYGLVDLVCTDEAADGCLKTLLKTLMRAEPGALAATKNFLELAAGLGADELRPRAVDALLDLMVRPETSAAISAFAEGSTPPWFKKFKPQGPLFWRKND